MKLSKPQINILKYMNSSSDDTYHFYWDIVKVGSPSALIKLDRAKLINGVFTGWDNCHPQYSMNDAGRQALDSIQKFG